MKRKNLFANVLGVIGAVLTFCIMFGCLDKPKPGPKPEPTPAGLTILVISDPNDKDNLAAHTPTSHSTSTPWKNTTIYGFTR